MNVIVPIAVRKKLMYVGLVSFSILRKITLDPTNVSTAKIARISPGIEYEKIREHKLFCIINPFSIKINNIITPLRKNSLVPVEKIEQLFYYFLLLNFLCFSPYSYNFKNDLAAASSVGNTRKLSF